MLKKLLLSTAAIGIAALAGAQITITSADVPVLGDTPRYSLAVPTTNLNLSNTGANIAWDYSGLSPVAQRVDVYKSVTAAGYRQNGIDGSAYGFLVAENLDFPGSPATLNNVYTFFSRNATRFAAVGYAGTVNSFFPISEAYSDADEWLNFPLTFGRQDNTTFRFTASVSLFGTVVMKGTRASNVDGWGTIVTPFLTTPTPALRLRTEVVETDSVILSGSSYAFPRHTVDYQWWVSGLRFPALWVSSTVVAGQETPATVRYRDSYRQGVGIAAVTKRELRELAVYPNPATSSEVRVTIPADWRQYETALYDATGRMIRMTTGTDKVVTSDLASGNYTIIVRSGDSYGAARFVK
jgi:hypothetical protein